MVCLFVVTQYNCQLVRNIPISYIVSIYNLGSILKHEACILWWLLASSLNCSIYAFLAAFAKYSEISLYFDRIKVRLLNQLVSHSLVINIHFQVSSQMKFQP